MGDAFGSTATEDNGHYGASLPKYCGGDGAQTDELGGDAEGVGVVARVGQDDAQVAFGVVVAHGEAPVGVALSTNGMGHLYVGQWFACFGVDHPARMVGEADVLSLTECWDE